MIVKTTQEDFLDIRLRLSDDGKDVFLAEDEKIQFKTDGHTPIFIESCQYDDDGRIVLRLDLSKFSILAGTYRFEINFISADGSKVCLSPLCENQLIVYPKAGDEDE